MDSFKLIGPESLAQLLQYISQSAGKVVFLSGGTDLVIQLKNGDREADLLVDISKIPELNYIKEDDRKIKIGSTTTFEQIASCNLINSKAKMLAEAAGQVGSVQIRNRATIGGNIASASPAGDSLPALLALDAVVRILGPEGEREIPIEKLLRGAGKTSLLEKEIIIAVEFPTPETNTRSCFKKVGNRKAVTIARLNMAVLIEYAQEQNRLLDAKIGIGALGKTAFRAKRIESFLAGKRVDRVLADELAVKLTAEVDRAIPGRYSQGYKKQVIQGVGYDILAGLFPKKFNARGEAR